MRQMTPKQVAEYLNNSSTKPVLLDVREPSEVKICMIEGSINVPLSQLPGALNRLDSNQEYVVICHHGMRSQRACAFLESQGFKNLINLAGGIDEWACNVAPEMQRY